VAPALSYVVDVDHQVRLTRPTRVAPSNFAMLFLRFLQPLDSLISQRALILLRHSFCTTVF
jgi:hypothetical protein